MVDAVSTGSFSEMVTADERKQIVSEICGVLEGPSVADRIRAVLPREPVPGRPRRPHYAHRSEVVGDGDRQPHLRLSRPFPRGRGGADRKGRAKAEGTNDQAWQIAPAEYVEKKATWEAMIISG